VNLRGGLERVLLFVLLAVAHRVSRGPVLSGLLPALHESLQARPARLGHCHVQVQFAGR
jgi:hypothetical protein